MAFKTPLYDEHVRLNGKIVEFGGYLLPVQYPSGVIAEHMAVRTGAGIFDVSHMGEILYKGKDALANLNYVLTNDFTNLKIGRIRYSVMCYEDGGCVDDLIVYRLGEESYLCVVNAGNRVKDAAWMKEHLFGDVEFKDISDDVAQLAIQGPLSGEVLGKYTEFPEKYYSFIETTILGKNCMVSQTGYTGEYGFEIYCRKEDVVEIYRELLKDERLVPCGLGARDTLRLEAGMPLYGHEMDETVSPLETGLDFGVKLHKDFIGKEGILNRVNRHRIGIKMIGRGIAREHCDVYKDGELIGHTTSGTHLPYLKGAYAMALVKEDLPAGTKIEVDIRGKRVEGEVTALPFYKREK
ncbi:MAG: glycine cleavage system aminomethyltransferase GcvT [Erysipelotrichales bacterium]|nr:glycine cleavage system aminomethyltransferase GcvT [Erysipelotrichales bacterium]